MKLKFKYLLEVETPDPYETTCKIRPERTNTNPHAYMYISYKRSRNTEELQIPGSR